MACLCVPPACILSVLSVCPRVLAFSVRYGTIDRGARARARTAGSSGPGRSASVVTGNYLYRADILAYTMRACAVS